MTTADMKRLSIPPSLQRFIVPLIALSVAISQVLLYVIVMEPDFSVTSFELVRKSIVPLFIFILFFVTHTFREDRINYYLMILGLFIVFIGEVENVMDIFFNIVYPFGGIDLEDLSGVGLLTMGVGLFRYTQDLFRKREIVVQQKRETDLYADLLKHDLSNDLQALLGYIETTLLDKDELPPRSVELLSSAMVAGERMARLIQAFTVQENPTESEIVSLITGIAADAEKANRGLKINIVDRSDRSKLKTLGGTLLPCAFENLFRNAHEYAGENPLVTVEIEGIESYAKIIVSDNGPGISPEKKDKLFLRGTGSDKRGLGLYLTKAIIRACGGTIELEDDHPGATFRILLPLSTM